MIINQLAIGIYLLYHSKVNSITYVTNNEIMRPPSRIDFAALCKQLRKHFGLTQQKMADKLNVHLVTYKQWELGNREPNAQAAFRLCELWNELNNEQKKG